MNRRQYKKLMEKLDSIEKRLSSLECQTVTWVYPSYPVDTEDWRPQPVCYHPNVRYDSAGWHCPDCCLSGYTYNSNVEELCQIFR